MITSSNVTAALIAISVAAAIISITRYLTLKVVKDQIQELMAKRIDDLITEHEKEILDSILYRIEGGVNGNSKSSQFKETRK